LPVLRGLRREVRVPLSIDTYKSKVARAALDAGADIVTVIAREQVPVVLMHMRGKPRTMQVEPHYGQVVGEVRDFLAAQAGKAIEEGVAAEGVILDPGIGFGKTLDHNLELLRDLPALAALGHPLLVGASRKTFIGKILKLEPEDRLEGSLAAAVAAVLGGANILRVHDIKETVRAARIADALRYGPDAS
jgi:dihydropteroate synthase